jgi:predicted nucleic acid-binding protein
MATSRGYLIDTNILVRISQYNDPRHHLIQAALDELNHREADLYFSLQNLTEFWNVCTRPQEKNGYGLSIAETALHLAAIEGVMTYLPDTEQVCSIWRSLVIANNVRGVQVHDAHLAATMLAHGVTHILTLNQADFLRYAGLQAVHPSQLLSQASD